MSESAVLGLTILGQCRVALRRRLPVPGFLGWDRFAPCSLDLRVLWDRSCHICPGYDGWTIMMRESEKETNSIEAALLVPQLDRLLKACTNEDPDRTVRAFERLFGKLVIVGRWQDLNHVFVPVILLKRMAPDVLTGVRRVIKDVLLSLDAEGRAKLIYALFRTMSSNLSFFHAVVEFTGPFALHRMGTFVLFDVLVDLLPYFTNRELEASYDPLSKVGDLVLDRLFRIEEAATVAEIVRFAGHCPPDIQRRVVTRLEARFSRGRQKGRSAIAEGLHQALPVYIDFFSNDVVRDLCVWGKKLKKSSVPLESELGARLANTACGEAGTRA